MEIIGTIENVFTSTFKTREGGNGDKTAIIIEYKSGDYFHKLAVDFFGKEAVFAAKNAVGQLVKINFVVKSREYDGKWYTNCSGLSIKPIQ